MWSIFSFTVDKRFFNMFFSYSSTPENGPTHSRGHYMPLQGLLAVVRCLGFSMYFSTICIHSFISNCFLFVQISEMTPLTSQRRWWKLMRGWMHCTSSWKKICRDVTIQLRGWSREAMDDWILPSHFNSRFIQQHISNVQHLHLFFLPRKQCICFHCEFTVHRFLNIYLE